MEQISTCIKHFAVAIFASAVCSFFVVDPAAGQFTEEWEKSKADGNHPTYISDGTGYSARGIAYGMVDDGNGTMVERVFVASDANGAYRVYVVDPSDGTLLDSLDVSGVSGGSRVLTDVAVSNDGIIFACNEANNIFIGGGQDFKCYRWDSLTDSPTQVISFLPPDADSDGIEDWVGSHITVTGSTGDNSLLIHTAAVDNSPNLYQFSTSDNGSSFTPDTLVAGDSSTVSVEDAYPTESGFYHTVIEEPATEYDTNGNAIGQIPTGVADSLVSLQIFEANGQTFLAGAKNNFGGGTPAGSNSRVRIANITNGASNATMYGETPDLGDTQQFQGNGDVDVRVNDDGTATFFFLSTNNGIAAFTANEGPFSTSPITLDGQLDESDYIPLGTNVDAADGFSPTNDVDSLIYYPDEASGDLYVAVAGTLETDNVNGYALFLNVEGSGAPTGAAAGDTLGFPSETTNYHFLSGDETGSNTDFTADFEVDYVVAASPTGAPDTTVAVAASYTGSSPAVTAIDTSDESGGVGMGTGANGEMVSFAHNNSEDPLTGAEFKIPFTEIGASASNNVQVFAVIVSGTGYFSNETIPGDGTQIADSETDGGGNPGNDAQWSAYAGGPYHTGGDGLPVELSTFTAQRDGNSAVLSWQTASETNNAGFAVQHAVGSGDFQQIGWVNGAGTTTEARTYQFTAEDLSAGTHRFRLKQEDLDGSTSLSDLVEVDVRPEGPIAIKQVAPNPVRETTTLQFTARESGEVTVSLYDVLGRQVKTLHDGRVSGGQSQQVTLDANGLSSGVYFFHVKGEDFTETRRMTVVK